jgi:acetylserotonin N-methyltransferase
MIEAQPVLDLIEAFRASKAMFTAVSLGIFDRLEQGPAGARELAAEKGCHADALERLLDACVALGLLARTGDCYGNRPVASRYLRIEAPETLAGYILYSDRILYPLWGRLEDAVREGSHRWEQTFGGRSGVFEELFSTPESRTTFIAGMHGFGLLTSPAVAASVDLSGFSHLCDLGGATGHLAIEACRRYPGLRATVYDLPGVIPQAQRYIEGAGFEGRIAVHSGDFFTDPLPEADLFALGQILHDWPEPKIGVLLDRIYSRLPLGGGVLICEKILFPFRDGPLTANLQSLNMLICMEGKERTAAQYEALLSRAGFRHFQARSTGRPLDAMLAIK